MKDGFDKPCAKKGDALYIASNNALRVPNVLEEDMSLLKHRFGKDP